MSRELDRASVVDNDDLESLGVERLRREGSKTGVESNGTLVGRDHDRDCFDHFATVTAWRGQGGGSIFGWMRGRTFGPGPLPRPKGAIRAVSARYKGGHAGRDTCGGDG